MDLLQVMSPTFEVPASAVAAAAAAAAAVDDTSGIVNPELDDDAAED